MAENKTATGELVKALRCPAKQEDIATCDRYKRDGSCCMCLKTYIHDAAGRLEELEARLAAAVEDMTLCEDGYCTQRRVWERLKEYEDAEEQGRLALAKDTDVPTTQHDDTPLTNYDRIRDMSVEEMALERVYYRPGDDVYACSDGTTFDASDRVWDSGCYAAVKHERGWLSSPEQEAL